MKHGNELHPEDQKHALAAFVHRHTGEHIPGWTRLPCGKPYPVQFTDDQDWLANTCFAVKSNGRLDHRAKFCESHPTWPHNPELRNTRGSAKP